MVTDTTVPPAVKVVRILVSSGEEIIVETIIHHRAGHQTCDFAAVTQLCLSVVRHLGCPVGDEDVGKGDDDTETPALVDSSHKINVLSAP